MEKHKHVLDMRKFLSEQFSIISDFISRNPNSINELANDKNWITEEVLKLIVRWSTGITTTIIQQDVIKKVSSIKKSSKVKADQAFITPTIHATITEIGEYSDDQGRHAYTLKLAQKDNDHLLQFAVHGALVPFIRSFLAPGHKIHIANARFLNDIIIPTQLVIVDLKKTQSEVDFIINSTKDTSLRDIKEDMPIPNALLLRVINTVYNGVLVTDGSTTEYTLSLDEERKCLRNLLRFNDVIVMYRPDVVQEDTGFVLRFGPDTVILRVPATGDTKTSQFTQKASTLSQDGLLIRNSTSCRSIDGHVINVKHFPTSSKITVLSSENKNVELEANYSSIPSSLANSIKLVKKNHYVWGFGLSVHNDESSLTFNDESTFFDTSLMHGIIASSFIPKYSLKRIDDFDTFVTRAVITSVKCESKEKYMHMKCHTVSPRKNSCNYCINPNPNDFKSVIVVSFSIDDGTCDPVDVVTTHDKLPFWGVSPGRWNDANEADKEKMKRRLLGQQFIFALSSAEENEFGGYTDAKVWRVDVVTAPVGDAQTHVNEIRKWFEKNKE